MAVLLDRNLAPGTHQVAWDGRNQQGQSLASGVYLARLTIGASLITHKIMLVR